VITLRATGRVSTKLQFPAAVSLERIRMDVRYTERSLVSAWPRSAHVYIR